MRWPLDFARIAADDLGMAASTEPTAQARPTRIVRAVTTGLLWAAPIGAVLAVAVLVASGPYFRHGPDTPSAGDVRAWNAIWGAAALIASGCTLGLLANLAWLLRAWREARRPRPFEWSRVILHLVCGAGFAWFWFAR